MANTSTSTYMSLPIPVVGQDPGPQYAIDLNTCLSLLDAHDHTPGNGTQITPSGLNINSDLTFNSYNATSVRSVRLLANTSPLAIATDLGCLYRSGVDLYYNDGNGNQVRITQSGGVGGTPGSIANLTSPASAAYVAANSTFVFQSAANTPANLDGASLLLRNLSANSKSLTLSPPNAMAGNYSITLPAIPVQTNILAMDTSGNITASINVDNSSIQLSANTISIKAAGVTNAMMAANSVGTSQIINLNVTTGKLADRAITAIKTTAGLFVSAIPAVDSIQVNITGATLVAAANQIIVGVAVGRGGAPVVMTGYIAGAPGAQANFLPFVVTPQRSIAFSNTSPGDTFDLYYVVLGNNT
jgi:hypothetical protein